MGGPGGYRRRSREEVTVEGLQWRGEVSTSGSNESGESGNTKVGELANQQDRYKGD